MQEASTPAPKTAAARRPRGRPRDPATDERILEAARTLLATKGYDALTFDAISQMTGITRATIYRRWPSKVHLTNEVANGTGEVRLHDVIADRNVATQIRTTVRQVVDQYARPETGAASVGLITAFQHDPALRKELQSPLEDDARARIREIVEKGISMGKIDPSVDPDSLFDLISGATIYRSVFSAHPLPPTFVDDITEILVRGIAPRSEGRAEQG